MPYERSGIVQAPLFVSAMLPGTEAALFAVPISKVKAFWMKRNVVQSVANHQR